MSLWVRFNCKVCGRDKSFQVGTTHHTYETYICKECNTELIKRKREEYFNNNYNNKELEDYQYVLGWIANSDVWFDFDNPKTVEEVYDECVRMATTYLDRHKNSL